jgi:hypothetical protein
MVLYVAMGYASHRAWTVGMASTDPDTMKLAQVGFDSLLHDLILLLVYQIGMEMPMANPTCSV